MTLATSTYSAWHGYVWSHLPPGFTPATLEKFLAFATESRPDFPAADAVDAGLVSDGAIAAVFTLRRVADWDSSGRASDYGAFAFFPTSEAGKINVPALLLDCFFHVPDRTPPPLLTYTGPAAETPPLDAAGRLLCRQSYRLEKPAAAGALLAEHAAKSDRWIFRFLPDGAMDVVCNGWKLGKERRT